MERIEVKRPDLVQTDNLGTGTNLDGFAVYRDLNFLRARKLAVETRGC